MDIDTIRQEGNTIYATVVVTKSDLWGCVQLVDNEGNRWHTTDMGTQWECDSKSFTVELVKDRRIATFGKDGYLAYRKA